MNKRTILLPVSLAIILSLSAAVIGLRMFKPNESETTPEPQDGVNPPEIPPEPPQTVIEKPKFHIFDVELEFPMTHDMKVAFQLQNLGNVTANGINISFDIKLSSGDTTWFLWSDAPEDFVVDGETAEDPYGETVVKFIWIRANVTIDKIESKETNEYYIYDLWTALAEGLGGDVTTGYEPDAVILESYWIITCTEGVTETFHFQTP